MSEPGLLAAVGGVALVAIAAFFFLGRSMGRAAQRAAYVAAKTSAEETAKRIIGEAERESDSLRKAAVVSGKEESLRLREQWEGEASKRREEIERGERRVQERESAIDRKFDLLEQREKDVGRKASDVG